MRAIAGIRTRSLLAVLVCAGVFAGGCAGAQPATPTEPEAGRATAVETREAGAPDAGATVDPASVRVGMRLAQIRGHHRVALELYRAGDRSGAVAHASHPVGEVYPAIRLALASRGAPTTALRDALEVTAQAASGDSADNLEAAIASADDLADQARSVVAQGAGDDVAFQASVIANLAASAAQDYAEAFDGGVMRRLPEYQDAYGFASEARDLYAVVAPEVEAMDPGAALEVGDGFQTLTAAIPGPQPPATPASVVEVRAAADRIASALERGAGAVIVGTPASSAEARLIAERLDEIVAKVAAGDREAAAEIAAATYLEHYETIEPEVIEKAPDVNAQLEPLLGAELRRQIAAGASAEDIRNLVDRAQDLLEQVVAAMETSE